MNNDELEDMTGKMALDRAFVDGIDYMALIQEFDGLVKTFEILDSDCSRREWYMEKAERFDEIMGKIRSIEWQYTRSRSNQSSLEARYNSVMSSRPARQE